MKVDQLVYVLDQPLHALNFLWLTVFDFKQKAGSMTALDSPQHVYISETISST